MGAPEEKALLSALDIALTAFQVLRVELVQMDRMFSSQAALLQVLQDKFPDTEELFEKYKQRPLGPEYSSAGMLALVDAKIVALKKALDSATKVN